MRLDQVDDHSSICRYIWPIAIFMTISYGLLAYLFTNEELKEFTGIEFYILLGIPMMFAVGYCKLRVYFPWIPEIDLSHGAIEIHEKVLKVKNKEYDLLSIEKVDIQSIVPVSKPEEITKNEILIKLGDRRKSFYFQLSTIEECQKLVNKLNKILGEHIELELSEKIKELMPTLYKNA